MNSTFSKKLRIVRAYVHDIEHNILKLNISTSIPKDICLIVYSYFGKECIAIAIGNNTDHQFGIPQKKLDKLTKLLQMSELLSSPMDIYISYTQTVIRDINGYVFVSCNSGKEDSRCFIPMKILPKKNVFAKKTRIELVSEGSLSEHFLFLSVDNKLYFSGCNSDGQCSIGKISTALDDNSDLMSLTHFSVMNEIFIGVKIIQIKTGDKHTLFLTDNGYVYGCGSNLNSQIGIPLTMDEDDGDILLPVQIPSLSNIKDICAGGLYSICVDNDNNLFVFGNNHSGQLGMESSEGNVEKPTLNSFFHSCKNKHFKSGRKREKYGYKSIQCSFRHSAVIDNDGNVYLFGTNFSGEIGNGLDDKVNVYLPYKLLTHVKYEQVALGYNHTLLLTNDNQLYACGSNKNNSCSTVVPIDDCIYKPLLWPKEDFIAIDERYDKIVKIAAGYHHSIIIMEEKMSAIR